MPANGQKGGNDILGQTATHFVIGTGIANLAQEFRYIVALCRIVGHKGIEPNAITQRGRLRCGAVSGIGTHAQQPFNGPQRQHFVIEDQVGHAAFAGVHLPAAQVVIA